MVVTGLGVRVSVAIVVSQIGAGAWTRRRLLTCLPQSAAHWGTSGIIPVGVASATPGKFVGAIGTCATVIAWVTETGVRRFALRSSPTVAAGACIVCPTFCTCGQVLAWIRVAGCRVCLIY